MEKDIRELMEILKKSSVCTIKSPCGQPKLRDGEVLPDDLKLFYEQIGGLVFNDDSYHFEIVGPNEMVLTNPVVVGELCEDDISSDWYIICKDIEDNYISIDMNEKRLGRCYDSFWDRHGVVGECSIVARSFTELLWNLMNNRKNEYPYWLEDGFDYIGDAYDEL